MSQICSQIFLESHYILLTFYFLSNFLSFKMNFILILLAATVAANTCNYKDCKECIVVNHCVYVIDFDEISSCVSHDLAENLEISQVISDNRHCPSGQADTHILDDIVVPVTLPNPLGIDPTPHYKQETALKILQEKLLPPKMFPTSKQVAAPGSNEVPLKIIPKLESTPALFPSTDFHSTSFSLSTEDTPTTPTTALPLLERTNSYSSSTEASNTIPKTGTEKRCKKETLTQKYIRSVCRSHELHSKLAKRKIVAELNNEPNLSRDNLACKKILQERRMCTKL